MWTGIGYDLRAAYEVNDVSTGIGFAAEGLGYLLLPHSYLPRPLDSRLVAVRLNEDSMRWPLQLIYPEDRTLSEPQRQLIACLQDELSAIP
jgi:DNA-binding transcriptional LysR family regulator